MEDEPSDYTIIDDRLAQYLILTGYYLYQGHKLEEISTASILNLKELVEMELTYRKGVFH